MGFTFHPMDEAGARAISQWRYDGPYAVYDMGGDAGDGDISGLLDPASPYYAIREDGGDLVGFCCLGSAALVWDVPAPFILDAQGWLPLGLGLRPDLTGRGLGLGFVRAIMAFAEKTYHPTGFVLYVIAFNLRAFNVYARAGFAQTRTVTTPTGHDFVEMTKPLATG